MVRLWCWKQKRVYFESVYQKLNISRGGHFRNSSKFVFYSQTSRFLVKIFQICIKLIFHPFYFNKIHSTPFYIPTKLNRNNLKEINNSQIHSSIHNVRVHFSWIFHLNAIQYDMNLDLKLNFSRSAPYIRYALWSFLARSMPSAILELLPCTQHTARRARKTSDSTQFVTVPLKRNKCNCIA